jgi:4-hydroxy-tetrahydrodipicolinate synthase
MQQEFILLNLKDQLKGIVVPLITPITKDERVDEVSLRKIVNYTLESGVHGLFVNSTTGEGVCLTDDEKLRNLKIVMKEVNGRVPVYAGISETSTKRTLECMAKTQQSGADILVAHAPFYYPPNNQEELVNFYSTVAKNADLPVMLYNIPFTTQAPLTIESARKLMDIENIVGIKDSSVDYVFLLNLIELKKNRPDFNIFIGKTHMWAAGIMSGADGGLDGISNLIPKHCVNLYKAIKENRPNIYDLQSEINEIWRVYECRSFLGGIKAAMNLLDLCEPYTVHPVTAASQDEIEKIKKILKKYNLL